MGKARLVLVRHGQSVYSQKNIFTGWTDVDLSEQGRDEAKKAGLLLKKTISIRISVLLHGSSVPFTQHRFC